MAKYINEFETLFALLEHMGRDNKIMEVHKAAFLLFGTENSSTLKRTVAALRTKDIDQLSLESVLPDQIQDWST